MLKDLSENEIKQGQDYVAIQKAYKMAGLAGGAMAIHNRGARQTDKDVKKEETARRAEYDNKKAAEQEWWAQYQKKRDSFQTDEEKDRWQARVERTGKL